MVDLRSLKCCLFLNATKKKTEIKQKKGFCLLINVDNRVV